MLKYFYIHDTNMAAMASPNKKNLEMCSKRFWLNCWFDSKLLKFKEIVMKAIRTATKKKNNFDVYVFVWAKNRDSKNVVFAL